MVTITRGRCLHACSLPPAVAWRSEGIASLDVHASRELAHIVGFALHDGDRRVRVGLTNLVTFGPPREGSGLNNRSKGVLAARITVAESGAGYATEEAATAASYLIVGG